MPDLPRGYYCCTDIDCDHCEGTGFPVPPSEWRYLLPGEIIQEGDEVQCLPDSWRDPVKWEPAKCIGQHAPDIACVAHRVYRRRIDAE